jgi:hypothetical protein
MREPVVPPGIPREIRCKRDGHFTATPGSYTEVEIPFE